jgi:DNA polymerase-3 subunit delta'
MNNNNEDLRPSTWQEIIGNQAAVARIRRLIKLDRVPHALLFSGPSGIGKRLVAEIMSAQLLQTEPALLESHPDYSRLSPDGTQIRIGQVREMQRLSSLAPVMGQFRVCVVEPADCMEAPAANCLLKILEEPPPGLIFVLITAFPHSLLSTIRSRAAHVRFCPAPELQQPDPEQLANRDLALDFLRNINKPGLEWLWPVVAGMEGMETRRILDIIKQWILLLRDIAVLSTAEAVTELYNFDCRAELESLAAGWSLAGIGPVIQMAETARRHLQRNANARLILESLLIRSADLYWGGKENADHRGSPV